MRDDECDSSSAVAMNALLMRVAAALGTVPLRDEQVIEAADRLTTLMHHAHGRKPTDPLFISMIGT